MVQGLLFHEVSRSHTTTHHSRYDSFGRVISSSQRPLPDNTQYSQQTGVHAPDGIRTHNLSRRAAQHLRLKPHGHWDRRFLHVGNVNIISCGVHVANSTTLDLPRLVLHLILFFTSYDVSDFGVIRRIGENDCNVVSICFNTYFLKGRPQCEARQFVVKHDDQGIYEQYVDQHERALMPNRDFMGNTARRLPLI